MLSRTKIVIAASALCVTAMRTVFAQAPSPCTSRPESHAFDFWIGAWDVTPTRDAPAPIVGTSLIERIAGGCGLLENWTASGGSTGKSLNAFNPATHQWQQYWVGQGGAVTEYRESVMLAPGIQFTAKGNTGGRETITRLTFTPLAENLVRQFGETSTDGGSTWSTNYDLYYHRAAGTSGTLVVTNMNDNTATLLDAGSLATLATLPTGHAPHEVAISHDGRWALVSNYGTRDEPGSTITVIDVEQRRVARTIDLGDSRRPHGMAFLPGDTIFAVTAEADRAVRLVDFRSGRIIRSLPSGGRTTHVVGLSADGRRMVASNIADNSIAILDPLGNDTTRDVKVPRQPEGIAITPDGARAWAGSNQDHVVTIVDLARGQPIDTLRGFGLAYRLAISPDGRSVVITDPVNATVRVFDEATRHERFYIAFPPDSLVPTAEVKGSASPEGVTISRDSKVAYVTLQGRNRVVAIDLERGVVRGVVRGVGVTGTWSDGIGYSPRASASPAGAQYDPPAGALPPPG
ncbi:MAG TPA: hypothetical protein VGM67_19350 [Gemmatimonadaceae bacterium]|jgi:DNA-binding beta-propeller fold protein YncE